jgi:hypothetical protein
MVTSKISLQGRRRKKAMDRNRKKSKARSVFRRHLFESLESRELLTVFDVTSLGDAPDVHPGDGIAADVDGHATLRAAIMEANAKSGADTIRLPAGIIELSLPGGDEQCSLSGDLDVTSDITIIGAGADQTTIDANGLDRVFELVLDTGARLHLQDLTVTGGDTSGTIDQYGGGILNDGGSLRLDSVHLTGNYGESLGGGLLNANDGQSMIVDSAVTENRAGYSGGGIDNHSGSLVIQNSTVSGNHGARNSGIVGPGSLSLSHVTVVDNVAGVASDPDIYHRYASDFQMNHSLVGSIKGAVESGGHNLVINSAGSSGLVNGVDGDVVGVDAQLGPLTDNGGPTPTHALLAGSPAIDAGNNDGASETDQRGMPRPVDGGPTGRDRVDIGAFEVVNHAPVAVDDAYEVDRDGVLIIPSQYYRSQEFKDDPGWTSSGNGEAGNHFGYQDGRIGGRFARSGFARHYGDLDLDAPVNLDQPFSASGTFEATDINYPDLGNGMTFGHFTAGGPDEGVQNGPFKVGIGLTNNSRGNELWWYGGILDNSGLAMPATGHVVLELDQQHSWSYSWDPQGGESCHGSLTVTLDGVTSLLELTAEQRAMLTTPLNAFGLSGNAASYPSSGKFAEFFIDDVNYTSGHRQGVLANDSDPDGDVLTSLLVDGPQHGTLELNDDGSFSYQPEAGYHGIDSFTYVALDGHSVSDPNGVGQKLYFVDAGTYNGTSHQDGTYANIRRANLDGTQVEDILIGDVEYPDLKALHYPTQITVDSVNHNIFWIDVNQMRLKKANFSGENIELLDASDESYQGIALTIDPIHEKVYWLEKTQNDDDRLRRANLDGTNKETLINSGIPGPMGLAIDVEAERLFWTETEGDRIFSSNLDGGDVEVIFSNDATRITEPFGIAVDPENQHIYWTERWLGQINRIRYDGSDFQVIFDNLGEPQGLAIDPQDGKLYWTDRIEDVVKRGNLDGTAIETILDEEIHEPLHITLDLTNGMNQTVLSKSNVATVTIDVLCADGSAPVISPLGEAVFTSINEDNLENAGNSVAEIVGNSIHDADDDSVEGIAVVAVESERGQWQYSLDTGASWQDLEEVSQQEALLLRAEDRLRLVPDGKDGEAASIQYRAWDQTGPTESQQGSRVDVTDAGEATPFSVEVDRAEIIASDVNDAPTLDAGPGESFQLDSIGHDQHDNPGNSVAEIAAAEIHDVDFHAVEGIAVTGTTNGKGGRWEFFADGGDQWIPLENVDSSHALLLRAEDRIRFLPMGRCADQAGFRFRAWDQTADTLGGEGTYVSIDEVGGTTPYSNDIAEASITIDFDLPDFIVRDDSFDVQEDSSQNLLDVLANDSPLSMMISSVGTSDQGGQVSVSPDGQVIIYTPAADFHGAEHLDYTAADTVGRLSSGTILVNVLPVNDDPTAVEDRFQVAEDSSGNLLDVLANDTSSPDEGEQLRVVDVSMPSAGGTVQVSLDGLLRYSPDADFHGLDQFSYTIEDGNGGRSTARVVIEVESINDDPIANADSFQVSGAGQDHALDVLANDSNGPESGEKLEIVSVTAGSAGGSVTIGDADEILFYRPRDGFAGQETFHYTISDGHGGWAVANVTVDVVEVIRQVGSPAVDDTYVSLSSEDLETFSLDVMVNDRLALDEGIWLVSVDEPGHGTATIDPSDGVILYQPEEGFIGTDQFHYAVSDIDGVIHRAEVTVQVQPGADDNDLVRFSMEVVDLEYGEVISEIEVGESFELRVFVQDMRSNVRPQAAGVFAAYLDLLYPADLVQLSDSPEAVQFSGSYGNVQSGDIRTPGVIDELGAVQSGLSPLGGDRIELVRAVFDTIYVGTATMTADPADQTPAHSTLIFHPPQEILAGQLQFTETTLTVLEPDPTRHLDVNGDGAVSPIDALGIINDLNFNGPGPVDMPAVLSEAEGESITRGRRFLDVNRDHYVSPMDALAVINHLNQASGLLQGEDTGMGEGEAAVDPGQPVMAGDIVAHAESISMQTRLASVIDTSEVAEVSNRDGHQQAAHGLSLDLRHELPGSQSTDQAMDSLFAEFDEIGLDGELISELAKDVERAWSV